MEVLTVNGREFAVLKLLGKGKGGYSYLVEEGERQYVLKQIHHEPCSYYSFGNKIEAELSAYGRLSSIGIRMPELVDVDMNQERILKEYINGDTVLDLVERDRMKDEYFDQMKRMCALLYPANTNIDYFPTNFVVRDDLLYYVDYECNPYSDEWNFENWGIRYWSRTPEFTEHLAWRDAQNRKE